MIDDRDEDEQRAEIERRRTEEGVEELNELAQVQWLLDQPSFRDFMWRVLQHCHVWGSVFDGNMARMAFMEGERNVGLWLLKELIEANPDRVLEMQLKANQKKAEQAREQREKKVRRSAANP